MRGVRGKVFGLGSLVLVLSCGRTSIDDALTSADGTRAGAAGDATGGDLNVGGTPGIAGAGGRHPTTMAGAGGHAVGGGPGFGGAGGGLGFGGDLPIAGLAGAPFGGQAFGGFGGAQAGAPFGGAAFGGNAPLGGAAFGGAAFGGFGGAQAGAPFGGFGGAQGGVGGAAGGASGGSGGNAGAGGVGCTMSESCPSCKPGICAPTPSNCAFANDLALDAEPSATHGGIGGYGPGQLNDGLGEGQTCHWAWVDNNTGMNSGAYFELDWPKPVTFQSVYIDTGNANGEVACEVVSGRNLLGGELQWWNGSAWITAQTWDNQLDDFVISLPAPIVTTKLRLFNVRTSLGNGNSLIFELYVAAGPACSF